MSPPFFIKLQSEKIGVFLFIGTPCSQARFAALSLSGERRGNRIFFSCLLIVTILRRGNLISTINANTLVISSRVRDGSENPLRSKECSVQPDPKGHAQKNIKKQQPFQTAVNEIIIGFFYNLNASFTTST